MKQLQEMKYVCGMIGDGFYDAPYLKKAYSELLVDDAPMSQVHQILYLQNKGLVSLFMLSSPVIAFSKE
jgi:hypothetical protein